ncbi:MAG TPA: hypothetical protein VM870_06585 [Pyrinomonadaceae bacterium]|nr:hypothetical protein [Pyrinomonadaceae bacterium]
MIGLKIITGDTFSDDEPPFVNSAPPAFRGLPKFVLLVGLLFAGAWPAFAEEGSSPARSVDEIRPLIVDGTESSDVFGLGRSVEVRGTVKYGVVAFGGDVIVAGRVEGDVAAIGGDVIQRENSYIGGDIIVLGGAYHHAKGGSGRNPASKTIMFAGYEQELRDMLRHPSTVLTPVWSPTYVGVRVLAVLFWFLCSLALTAVTPDTVSRAATRLQLTSLRVAVIGVVGALVIALGVPICLRLLPPVVGAVVLLTSSLLILIAYLFGRIVVHATTGRWLQRLIFPEGSRSESNALLLGTAFWVILLSLPFVWPIVLIGLLMVSLGLALTARYRLHRKLKV